MSNAAIDAYVIDRLVNNIKNQYPDHYLKQWAGGRKYIKYQNNPVGFGKEVLRERYYDKVEELMNSVRDYRVTVAISANSTGKTHSAASLALWCYLCFPGARVITLAAPPEKNLKELLWGELGKKKLRNEHLFEGHTCNVMDWKSPIGSSILGVTIPQSGSPEKREACVSGKHSEYMLFIVDEADAVDKEIFKGISNCMTGGWCRLLCTFNPRKMSGSVYEMIRDNKANVVHLSALDHPNVITGEDLIPGAVDRETVVRRLNDETMPVLEEEVDPEDRYYFKVPDFFVGYVAHNEKGIAYPPLLAGWRKIQSSTCAYQTFGLYPKEGDNQLISKEWVDAARTRWSLYSSQNGENPPEGIRPILGLDVAVMGEDKSALCARYGGWVARIQTWQNMEPNETAERAADIAKSLKATDVRVDAIAVGADVPPLIKKMGVKATKVIVSEKPNKTCKRGDKEFKFSRLRDQLYWDVREWISSDVAMIPPDQDLVDELLALTYEEDPTGRIRVMSKDKMRDILGRSPDRLDALTMTFASKGRAPRVWRLS